MKLIDQHMHTNHSFDSKAKMEDYIIQTDGYIVTTEHLDFKDPSQNYGDNIPDYQAYQEEIDRLNAHYNNRILKGIEIGWTAVDQDLILDFLKDKTYDLALLSVHQNGFYDYMDPKGFTDQSVASLIPQYLEALYQAVDFMHPYVNVLAHFDYGFRIHKITVTELELYGTDALKSLFKLIIEKDIAFELNTSSMYKHNNLPLYDFAIKHYIACGGTRFTLGSDAHFAQHYKRNFDDAIELLKQHDVPEVVCYINQKPITIKL